MTRKQEGVKKDTRRTKYYLVGSYPPPIGGISVFVYRFTRLLKARGIDVENIDFSKIDRLARVKVYINFLFTRGDIVVNLNNYSRRVSLLLLLRPFKIKIIYHVHSCRYLDEINFIDQRILSLLLKKTSELILVGDQMIAEFKKHRYSLPRNTRVESAYIQPPLSEEGGILKTYGDLTTNFVRNRHPLIVANASKIVFYKGIDLYGLDLCIELIKQLKLKYPKIGLLFALAEVGDRDYFEDINKKINSYGIRDNVEFMTGNKEIWPLFKKADLMIRPTCSDGYGISIVEAIQFKCPAIASDVCERPVGTILFKNRDIDDLIEKANSVLCAKTLEV